jgi:hypothetical protein
MFATIATAAPSGPYRVGYRVLHAEGRRFDVAVWYLTKLPSATIKYGTARVRDSAAPDAPEKQGPWPLVVFAHGYLGSGIGSATIAEVVASYGVI